MESHTQTRATILVVDDEPNTVDLCRRVLREKYHVVPCHSGQEAQETAEGRDIAVALVDQRMPHMTGLDFLRRFSETHPRSARVVMTGYTDLEDIVALINEGRIHGFVLKPWHNEQLRLTVDREVDGYHKSCTIEALNEKLRHEHRSMSALLKELDPEFEVPHSNHQLKEAKTRLKQRVHNEVERLFLKRLLKTHAGRVRDVAQAAQINRTFLYRLLRRHGLSEDEALRDR